MSKSNDQTSNTLIREEATLTTAIESGETYVEGLSVFCIVLLFYIKTQCRGDLNIHREPESVGPRDRESAAKRSKAGRRNDLKANNRSE